MRVGGRLHLGEYWNLTPSLPLATPETIEYTPLWAPCSSRAGIVIGGYQTPSKIEKNVFRPVSY